MALVRRLLQQPGIDVNAPGQDGTPALHWAVRVNDVETAAALIRAGADPKRPNRYGLLPLSLAAQNANAAMIRLLAESGADANAPDAAGEAPLVTATGLGSLDAVQALIAAGAVVDAKDKTFQQTALMVAVRANHPPLVTLLPRQGRRRERPHAHRRDAALGAAQLGAGLRPRRRDRARRVARARLASAHSWAR